ncbi:transketolase [Asticcacaulis sp. BYS171W]|uniref:Transketolase n=1 Tax=Asticcacaulis aquaticus TaxID=2984212 RepID=A0ABT5HVJ9_9CAUL|nr:transketolase [Asticcacaulis aquaticus]MDC7684102.1 transketolase [Asticcacaulis aquaticus]
MSSASEGLFAAKPSPVVMADAIRVLSMEAVHRAKSGHQGMPMGMADVATVLFTKFLKYDPKAPDWADRDRFILSAGHGSMILYSLLHLTGYKSVSMEDIKNFRQWGSSTPGHPEYGHTAGVECTTGPLGQGLATSVGMAMAERHLNARFPELVDHRTWVIAGDGCLMEGVSHEAISLAGRLKLNKLIVLWDDNNVTIDGVATIAETGDQLARFKAAGWAVKAVDGHDHGKIAAAMRWATQQSKPVLIACKTLISKGAGPKEADPHSHGYTLFDSDIELARQAMGWTAESWTVPAPVKKAWEAAGRKAAKPRKAWEAKLKAHPNGADFTRAMKGELPADAFTALDAHIEKQLELKAGDATRSASGAALAQLVPSIDDMVGGSADLTGSNNTFVKGMTAFDTPNYDGRYVHYGVREFGMSAAMNGMALHGGVIPYSGTFFVFSDYSRPAIRLGALMNIRTINVLTHDSIGVGEDGPTHQPVEHLASFRAMPNLLTFRPADIVEAAESWKAALLSETTPSIMVLSRQKVPAVRTTGGNLTAKGAYEIRPASGEAKVSIFSSGTEVSVAVAAAEALEADGIPTRVVSTPCWALFDRQDAAYQASVIGTAPVRVAVEAAVQMGWEKFIGLDGIFVGMSSFGASAPQDVLYKQFGITKDAIVEKVKAKLA